MDEIWEAYFDLEEAILMAKVVFDAFSKPGKLRKLPEFSGVSDPIVRAAIQKAKANLAVAEKKLPLLLGDETIESLRRARDQLKALLVANVTKKSLRKSRKRA
jgi:hypothetical protein